jgi:hypothetical protein
VVKIFTDLAGINKLNYNSVVAGAEIGAEVGIPRVEKPPLEGGTATPTVPAALEKVPEITDEVSLAAEFLRAKGPTINALHKEIALSADLEHAQDEMRILRGMDDVSNRHGHLLGLKLNAVGDRLRQADMKGVPGNMVKIGVAAGIAFLAYHTAIEGASTIDAVQKLAAGASDLTKGIQNSTSVFNIDFSHVNTGAQEINNVIAKLTQHGIQTAEYGAGTVVALLVKPVDRVRDVSHGLGRALNVAGGAIGKALGTERVINPPVTKTNLQVVPDSK